MIHYNCNKCGAEMESPDSMIGKMETCPACHRRMKVQNPVAVAKYERFAQAARGLHHFYSKVAGVSHANDDGTDRQEIIARCEPLELLLLDHDEHNPYDSNAVRVRRENGEQIGFLSAELAGEVVEEATRGIRFAAFIHAITGGTPHKPIMGVNLLIVVAEPGVTDQQAQAYAETLDLSSARQPARIGLAHQAQRSGGADAWRRVSIGVLVLLGIGLFIWLFFR